MRSPTFVVLSMLGVSHGAAAVDLESMYQVCASCHAIGVANAPKLGDKRSWHPRLKRSPEALINSVRNGVPGTLMEGGICRDCTDQDILALIERMSGIAASTTEP